MKVISFPCFFCSFLLKKQIYCIQEFLEITKFESYFIVRCKCLNCGLVNNVAVEKKPEIFEVNDDEKEI